MTPVLERVPAGARISVIRLRSLGDCVLMTPALRILKSARPDLRISVIVEDAFAAVFEGNPDVERIVPPVVSEASRLRPDLVLNLHGGTRSAQLTLASHARLRAGFAHFRFSSLYNVRIPRAQEILGVERKVHTAEHLASAIFYLGVPIGEIPRACLFAAAPTQVEQVSRPVRRSRLKQNGRAVLHPFASAPEKTWPAANFRAVAEHLKHDGLDPVFIAGPGEGLAEFDRFECVAGAPLSEIKSLLAGASLFVGNDSGPAHMAAAFGVPSVVLFGASDHEIWAPWKTDAVVLKSPEIERIRVEEVTGALAGLHV